MTIPSWVNLPKGTSYKWLVFAFSSLTPMNNITLNTSWTFTINLPDGWSLVPLRNGEPMDPAAYGALPEAERKSREAGRRAVEHGLEDTLRQIRELEKATADSQRALDKQVAASVVDHQIDELKAKYGAHVETAGYLDEVRGDLLDHVSDFLPAASDKSVPPDFRRYGVNVVIDHSRTAGAPVIVELNPTFSKLMGRIEHEARMGALVTDFTLIKTGSLHAANGGYLVLRARDVYNDSQAWDALKRSLLSGFVRTEDIAAKGGFSTTRLDPEPIPLDLKVVLVGSSGAYYFLFDADEDFANIFKVKADFSSEMPRTPENEQQYAGFVAVRCAEESLRPFDCGAVAKVVEFGSRAAEDQTKLSVRFGEIADLLREADAIVMEEMHRSDLYERIWQFPVVLLPFGEKSGGQSIVLRPVESQEAMTARAASLPAEVLQRMTHRILELPGIDFVFFDLTSKPPATIEWE